MHIGYARVSTNDQNEELQVDALTKAGCEKIYTEKMTGSSKERPILIQCLDTLREGDVLLVWKLDRLGRNLRHLVDTVCDLSERNIGFRVLSGHGANIDTSTPSGKLIFGIFASLAEFEREIIRERTNAGLAAARARGRKGGRPLKLSNSDVKKAKAMLLDPMMTVTEIAEHFQVSRKTLYDALKRCEGK